MTAREATWVAAWGSCTMEAHTRREMKNKFTVGLVSVSAGGLLPAEPSAAHVVCAVGQEIALPQAPLGRNTGRRNYPYSQYCQGALLCSLALLMRGCPICLVCCTVLVRGKAGVVDGV